MAGTVVTVCVVQTRRYIRPEDLAERRMNHTALAVAGTLIALVAVRAGVLRWYGTVVMLGLACTVGYGARFGMALGKGDERRWRTYAYGGSAFFGLVVCAAVLVSIVDDPARHRTPAQRDTARFGVTVHDEETRLPDRSSRTARRSPTPAHPTASRYRSPGTRRTAASSRSSWRTT
jgi:hypothetical protein